jgi:RecJ-like exonuclease
MSLSNADCPRCEGKGYIPCDVCNGKGSVFKGWRANPDGSENDLEVWDDCPKCLNDSDWMFPNCPECRGTGKVYTYRSVA